MKIDGHVNGNDEGAQAMASGVNMLSGAFRSASASVGGVGGAAARMVLGIFVLGVLMWSGVGLFMAHKNPWDALALVAFGMLAFSARTIMRLFYVVFRGNVALGKPYTANDTKFEVGMFFGAIFLWGCANAVRADLTAMLCFVVMALNVPVLTERGITLLHRITHGRNAAPVARRAEPGEGFPLEASAAERLDWEHAADPRSRALLSRIASSPSMWTPTLDRPRPEPTALIGVSRGDLYDEDHIAGIPAGEPIALSLLDIFTHILITGGVGSGKTFSFFNRVAAQVLDPMNGGGCGALALAAKHDSLDEYVSLAFALARPVTVWAPGVAAEGFVGGNLIEGETPENVAKWFVLLYAQGKDPRSLNEQTRYFVNHASQWMMATLTLLKAAGRYDLGSAWDYLSDGGVIIMPGDGEDGSGAPRETFADQIDELAATALDRLEAVLGMDADETVLLRNALHYRRLTWRTAYDDKARQNFASMVGQYLQPFSHPAIRRAFAQSRGADLASVFDGNFVVVQVPDDVYGEHASVMLSLLKSKMFDLSLARKRRGLGEKPVVILADEYQRFLSATDLNFLEVARSHRVGMVAATQSFSKIAGAIGQNEARALFAAFRSHIAMATEDPGEMEFLASALGEVDTERRTVSKNTGGTSGWSQGGFSGGASQGEGESVAEARQRLVSGQRFRSLRLGEALAVLRVEQQPHDDVIVGLPYSIDTLPEELLRVWRLYARGIVDAVGAVQIDTRLDPHQVTDRTRNMVAAWERRGARERADAAAVSAANAVIMNYVRKLDAWLQGQIATATTARDERERAYAEGTFDKRHDGDASVFDDDEVG